MINNLKDENLLLPLGCMVCVTGVSGSGKSSLNHGTLSSIIKRELYKSKNLHWVMPDNSNYYQIAHKTFSNSLKRWGANKYEPIIIILFFLTAYNLDILLPLSNAFFL